MPNNVSNVGFQNPGFDYGADLSKIERSRALAAQLQQHSMEQDPTQSVGGWAIKQSPWSGLAKVLQGGAAGYVHSRADQQQRDLSAKAQQDYQQMLAKGISQMQGTPGSPQPSAELGGGPAQPVQAPDPAGAMGTFGSHPMGAPMMPLAMQEMSRQRLAQALSGGGQQVPQQAPQQNPMAPGAGSSVMAGSGSVTPQQTPQQPQQPPTGGPAGGLPMAAWLQVDPTGKLYMEQLAKDHMETQKPVINRGFGIGRMGPNGYVPDQASLTQALDMEKGKAGVGAAYGVHNVQQAGGGSVPMFGYQLPGYGGLPGNPVKSPSSPQAPQQRPTQAPVAQPQPQPTTRPGDPWSSMPRLEHPQGIGQSTYTHGRQAEAAKYGAEMATKMGPIAESANQRKSFNEQSLNLLDQATTGPGALSITGIQNFLSSRLGISEATLTKAGSGDPTATLELNKNLINAATQTAKANYGSRMTQSEVMMQIKQASPNVDMTKAAIRYLLMADNARADYQMRQSQDLGKYLQQGGDPYQFEGWYAKAFPMGAVTTHAGGNRVKDIVNSGSDPLGIRK